MMTEELIRIFDGMSDEQVSIYLFMAYGQDKYFWEDCSKEEYEQHVHPINNPDDFVEHAIRNLKTDYYAEPVYEDGHSPFDAILGKAEVKIKEWHYRKRIGRYSQVDIESGLYEYLRTKRPAVFKNIEKMMEASVEMFNNNGLNG